MSLLDNLQIKNLSCDRKDMTMVYKWSTETFRKSEMLSNGEQHDYSGERYWIDISSSEGIKMDVVLKKVSKDSTAPVVTGKFRVNGMVIKKWEAATLQEAADIGEKLIDDLKLGMCNIT